MKVLCMLHNFVMQSLEENQSKHGTKFFGVSFVLVYKYVRKNAYIEQIFPIFTYKKSSIEACLHTCIQI
jgi:hypothetical protein